MKIELDILIVNFCSSDFVGNALSALRNLTSRPYRVLILDNGSPEVEFTTLRKMCDTDPHVDLIRRETRLRGSAAHGSALNLLARKVRAPYFAVLDADATFLLKKWDRTLIEMLNEKTPVIGTQAPPGKPQDFPLMFATIFRTKEFRELRIDFRPQNPRVHDTGWEIRKKYLQAGYEGILLEHRGTREYQGGPFKDVVCAEYYLQGVPHIIASHFGRGSSGGEHKYRKGFGIAYRIPIFGTILRLRKGAREKAAWIRKCQEIVEAQA